MNEGKFVHSVRDEVFGAEFIGKIVEVLHEWFLRLGTIALTASVLLVGIDLVAGDILSKVFPNAELAIAIVLVAAIEAQGFVLWRRAVLAHERKSYFVMLIWGLLGTFMSLYGGQMFLLWSLMHGLSITETQTFVLLHISPIIWWGERGILGFLMLITTAITIVAKPPVRVESTEEKEQKIQEKARLTMAQAQLEEANAILERTRVAAELENAELKRANNVAKVNNAATAAAVGALGARQAAAALFRGKGPDAVMPSLPQPRMIDSALVPASFEQDGDDDDTPPPAPTDGPRRRGRPRGSRNGAGRSIELVSMESASPSGALLSTRANAGRSRKKDNPVYQRQVARAQQLLREAEAQSLLGRRVTLSVQNLVDDPMLKEQGIAVTSKSIATSIITDAKHRNEVEDLKAELRAS